MSKIADPHVIIQTLTGYYFGMLRGRNGKTATLSDSRYIYPTSMCPHDIAAGFDSGWHDLKLSAIVPGLASYTDVQLYLVCTEEVTHMLTTQEPQRWEIKHAEQANGVALPYAVPDCVTEQHKGTP